MTTDNRDDFKNAFKCHICDKEYTHISHTVRGYVSHFIMQEIGKFKMAINVIPTL